MPFFKYTAVDNQGKERKGRVQAADSRAAIAALRQQLLFVVEIDEGSEGGTGEGPGLSRDIEFKFLKEWRSVSSQELIFFFQQMTFMLRAGLPVLQALQLARTQVSSPRLGRIIGEITNDIENGLPLSLALSRHPKVFPPLTASLIVAGENTGELDVVMTRLAEHLEKKAALRMQTINALIYPVIVILASIGVMVFLVVKIIPAFAKFFAGRGQALPESTQFLMDLSAFALEYGLYIVGGLLFLFVAIAIYYRTRRGRLNIHYLILRLPVIGKLMTVAAMAQMNWTLAMTLKSGLTALESLKIAADVIANTVIAAKLRAAAQQILNGKELSASLQHPRIPAIVTQMIAVGERTGTLDHVLQQLGDYYQERLEIGIKRLSAMMEPAMILVIGGMVGFVYYAFFQALFQIAKV